jgi:hypothetical protein
VNRERRILVSVALAATLALAAIAVNRLLRNDTPGGWFVYAPDGEPTFSSGTSDGEKLREAAVWLVAIAFWFATSWRLFRYRQD